ncbi:MAG TPA: queuosine salvage family protein [Candidatus Xenobia bacterium]|nr:queuosine salvage family protein [Candidatus Xenobia bacterium]
MDRRSFLTAAGLSALSLAGPGSGGAAPKKMSVRVPKPIGSPVLDSILPVIMKSRDVRTDVDKIVEHAGWMAYEELPFPDFPAPFGLGADPPKAIDFILVSNAIDFAFTDFSTGVKFEVDYDGKRWSDSEAMFACLKRALDEGIPFLDGRYLSRITKADLQHIFRGGNIEMPMLEERVEVLQSVGKVLAERYEGRFHKFVESASPRLYDGGRGLVDKLVKEFPRFNDVSVYDGHEVKIYKLTQLGFWMAYATLGRSGGFRLEDPEKMTAFADYIVPVALRVMNILRYSPALESAIASGKLIPRDSPQEIEIRAHTIYATALLREEVNLRRPKDKQVIIPQIDARLWTHYHTTHWPHHLTRTIMY